jgi:hypothetical protein
MSAAEACRLCGDAGRPVARQRLLGRHDVTYFQCAACDLLFTERPYWLEEAYSHAISQLDTGAVERNRTSANLTLLLACATGLPATARCLDYGGGHGVFVRMMRDLGVDFRWYDLYAENLYARGFEGDPAEPHRLVTAFEVLEHFADVGSELERLFGGRPDLVFVGTVLHEGHRPGWWYYLLESGQHVSFFSRRTMEVVGTRFGYEAIVGAQHTVFVRRDHPLTGARRALVRRLVASPSVTQPLVSLLPPAVLGRLGPYRSKLLSDHEELRRRMGS